MDTTVTHVTPPKDNVRGSYACLLYRSDYRLSFALSQSLTRKSGFRFFTCSCLIADSTFACGHTEEELEAYTMETSDMYTTDYTLRGRS